jgi:tetrahydromethanopterin S-methyltransferase subunit B
MSNEDDYLKGYGMALVTLVNRINEYEIRIAELEDVVNDISNNVEVATFLLKTFIESQGGKVTSDT